MSHPPRRHSQSHSQRRSLRLVSLLAAVLCLQIAPAHAHQHALRIGQSPPPPPARLVHGLSQNPGHLGHMLPPPLAQVVRVFSPAGIGQFQQSQPPLPPAVRPPLTAAQPVAQPRAEARAHKPDGQVGNHKRDYIMHLIRFGICVFMASAIFSFILTRFLKL